MNEVLELGDRPALLDVELTRGSDASYGLKLQSAVDGSPVTITTTDAVLVLGGLPFIADKTATQYSWTILAADVAQVINNSKAELVFIEGNRRRVFASGKVHVR